MRALLVLTVAAAASAGDRFSFGALAGVPLTAVADSGRTVGRYGGDTTFHIQRYLDGAFVEAGLPWKFRVDGGALYRHARQDAVFGPAPAASIDSYATRMSIWEIPIRLKRGFGSGRLRPFAAAGPSLRRVSDLEVDLLRVPAFPGFPATRQHYEASTGEPLRCGITAGAGVSWRLGMLRVEPELRYTHWTSKHWLATTNEVAFVLGLAFP